MVLKIVIKAEIYDFFQHYYIAALSYTTLQSMSKLRSYFKESFL